MGRSAEVAGAEGGGGGGRGRGEGAPNGQRPIPPVLHFPACVHSAAFVRDERQGDPPGRCIASERSDLSREREQDGTPPPLRPMDIAESSRAINPFLAFYVLNVPEARRSS